MKIVIVYHSGRGHTAKQAAAVAEGARSVTGAEVLLVTVEDADQHWSSFAAADAIVFGCPTYMGSASAGFKTFMDASAKAWLRGEWRDKVAAGFTNSGSLSGDKVATLTQLILFACQHGMLWVGMELPSGQNSSRGSANHLNRLGGWLGAMAQSDVDASPETSPPSSDLRTAAHLGRRVAETALRWRYSGE